MPTANKPAAPKLYRHAFSASLAGAPTKSIFDSNGRSVTLHALPILPASPFRPTDSRSGIEFSYDADALVAAYRGKSRRIPLDIDHNTEGGGDTRARGWSVDFTTAELEPDAGLVPGPIYGWFELTSLGAQEIGDKSYGYTSGVALGVWLDESHVHFTRIKSLALTNNPATEMPMAFTADNEEGDEFDFSAPSAPSALRYTEQQTLETKMLETILKQLGLAADADEASITAAITALTAATAQVVATAATLSAVGIADIEAVATFAAQATATTEQLTAATSQVTTLTAQVGTLSTELSALKASAADKDVVAVVDTALSARKFTPAQRDSMLALARLDVSLFTAAMDAATPVISDAPAKAPATGATELTASEKSFLADFGFKPESLLKAKQQLSAE